MMAASSEVNDVLLGWTFSVLVVTNENMLRKRC